LRLRFAAPLVAMLLATPSVRAEQAGDPQRPFDEGRALVREGRFAEAVKKFEESAAIRATPGAYLNLGDCYEKLGRYASAVHAFERARALSQASGEEDRTHEATVRLDRVRPLRSTLTVRLPASSAGANVTIDDAPFAAGEATPIDGGEHVLRVVAPCKKLERRVTVGLRSTADVVDVVDVELAPDTTLPECRHREPATASTWTAQKTIGVIVASAGVTALGIGAGFGVYTLGKKDDLDSACASYPRECPIERKSELDGIARDADRSALISTIAFAAGAALVTGGVILFFTGGRGPGTAGLAATARLGTLRF
jgi:tetratricopeptide (TPR) repeat protein